MSANAQKDPPDSFYLTRRQVGLLAIGLAGLFLFRLVPFLSGDLWFDEVLTFDDYVLQTNLGGVLTQYPVANNHVLFSAFLWCWAQLIDPLLYEILLRLPSALFSATVIVIAVVHWRKWLGPRAAIACGVTFAASLVVASFAWQLRGYSLSMLLGAILLSGTMEIVNGNRGRGVILSMISAALLPIALPTNILLVIAHLIFLIAVRPDDTTWDRWLRSALLPLALAGAVGASYYLVVLKQFLNVLKHAEGWPSSLAVAGTWGLALIAHFGVIGVIFLLQQRALIKRGDASATHDEASRSNLTLAWKLLLPILGLFVVFLIASKPAPFPRTFLVFLPTITFAVFLACKESALFTRVRPINVALMIGAWAVLWQIGTDRLTANALARGEHPQNLLMQYYRGRSDVSDMTTMLRTRHLGDQIALLTDFHDFPTTRFYWRVQQLPAENVLAKFKNFDADWRDREKSDLRLVVQATSEQHAQVILKDARQPFSRLELLMTNGPLSLYLVEEPAAEIMNP